MLTNAMDVHIKGRRGLTCEIWEENTAEQVKDPSSAVEGDCVGVSILRTNTKVLSEPGDRYSRRPGTGRL